MKSYRPEIDGLRAVAVLPVVLFHAGSTTLSGGFVGVDVFFVISGYLITQIICQEIVEKRFSILSFYERRSRRIIPALALVTFLTVIPSWLLMRPDQLYAFGNSLIGVATYSSNITFWLGQVYFEESSELLPLLHTWSLAVEEQFYVFSPLLLLLLLSKYKDHTLRIIIFLCLISVLLSVYFTNLQSRQIIESGAFFLLPMRAWELGVGSCIALLDSSGKWKSDNSSLWPQTLSGVGFFLIVIPMVSYTNLTPFPGIAAVPPVVGSALILTYANADNFVGRILAKRVLVSIGLISYSLYLWHNPILSLYRIYQSDLELPLIVKAVLLAISLFLGYLSWRFVERPFRSKGFMSRKQIFAFTIAVSVVLVMIGYGSKGASTNFETKLALELRNSDYVYFTDMDERIFIAARLETELPSRDAVVLGSSRILQANSSNVGMPLYNFGVSGGSMEDLIGLGTQVVGRLQPKVVYLAADPWLFNKYDGNERWRSIAKWVDLGVESISSGVEIELVPGASFSTPWLVSLYNLVNLSSSASTKSDYEIIGKKAFDGSHVYSRSYSEMNDAAKRKTFDAHMNYSLRTFDFDSAMQKKFELLIAWVKSHGIEVKLVLSPYHPELYERIKLEKVEILEAEANFRSIGNSMGIEIVGSYDPGLVGCEANEFYDGMHPKKACISRVFR